VSTFLAHIAFARLVDLVEGRILEAERIEINRHLDACPRCQAELAQLEHLISVMRSDHSEDAPAQLIARAVRLFRRQVEPESPSLLRRIMATLGFDSAQLAPAMGVRSSAPSARQLLYRAGQHDLDVRITPVNDGWVVAGQVLSTVHGGWVELQGNGDSLESPLTELSEFTFPPMPPGEYKLVVYLADEVIEVASLSLGA
jgi:anti-sigma factor RsiW